uniref:Beta-hexosaminidase n=2 Tax=Trichobilharzia regenti TaxID=157069 RepID=A0AA85J5D2_TRIRE|nr:unnamed protein product [Trichobilharzia regenti]
MKSICIHHTLKMNRNRFPCIILLIHFTVLISALIPKPYEYNQTTTILCNIDETLQFIHDYHSCFILMESLKRFYEHLTINNPPSLASNDIASCFITSLSVDIEQSCDETENKLWPYDMMDESYMVNITDGIIEISSQEIWGTLHALETILQLVYRSESDSVIYQGVVNDVPIFTHRGIMIDTARHFLSISEIEKMIDAMSMVKMNTLHWHVTDDESFPYSFFSYPELSTWGSYDDKSTVYLPDEVNALLEYARLRGVRVIPEFQTPAHTMRWNLLNIPLLTRCFKGDEPDFAYGPMNPTENITYTFLSRIFNEVLTAFPDSMIHLGGSDVSYDCWKSNPFIRNFMNDNGYGDDYTKLESYYFQRLMTTILGANSSEWTTSPIVWQDVFENGFREETPVVIHLYKPDWAQILDEVTKTGYRAILSSCWDLSAVEPGDDWKKVYECDLISFEATDEQLSLIIGGEALLWGQYIDDANLFTETWPLAAAVAERLWSQEQSETDEFAQRLHQLRCQMLKRGWPAQVITGPGFCYP